MSIRVSISTPTVWLIAATFFAWYIYNPDKFQIPTWMLVVGGIALFVSFLVWCFSKGIALVYTILGGGTRNSIIRK